MRKSIISRVGEHYRHIQLSRQAVRMPPMKKGYKWFSLIKLLIPLIAILQSANTSARTRTQNQECTGVLYGVVIDPGGQPSKNLTVFAWPIGVDLGMILPHMQTNQAGEYRFEALCPGTYSVLPEDKNAGYPDSSPYLYEFLYGHPAPNAQLTDKTAEAELRIELPPKPGHLLLYVVSRKTKAHIRQFSVRVTVPKQHKPRWVEWKFDPAIDDNEMLVPPDQDFLFAVTADGFHKWKNGSKSRGLLRIPSGTQTSFDVKLKSAQNLKSR